MSSDADAWAVVTSDFLGDPKPIVMFLPDEATADEAISFRKTQTDLLPSLMVEKFPARLSPTLMAAVARGRAVATATGVAQFGVMMFDASNFSGKIARELRDGVRRGN